jgi:class 3 adenylate cyclase
LGKFTPDREESLKLLSGAIEGIISKVSEAARAREALSGLVRHDIAERLLNKQKVREEETGYLLVADIRGSSKLANQLGASVWNEFIDTIRRPLEMIGKKHRLSLQLVIWDAFYFTFPSRKKHPKQFGQFVTCAREINAFLELAFKHFFPTEIISKNESRARFCLEHGDTSRDIQNGTWTIVGAAIASASKLEAVCKPLVGWFFTTEEVPVPALEAFERLEATNPANGARIISLNGDVKLYSETAELEVLLAEALNSNEKRKVA